ncbi:MAG: DUF547 domain-containing protein [Planctomycetota bacterium]
MFDTPAKPSRWWPRLGGVALIAAAGIATVAWIDAAAEPTPTIHSNSDAFAGYDNLLGELVDADGLVDYDAIITDPTRLDAFIASLATVDLDAMSEDAKLATLINAYNAFTLRLIADFPDVDSIFDIPEDKRWIHARWHLAGKTVSLDALEHQIIRVQFAEPRIHWAVVCAAISCPPLRPEAYVADRLDEQLADQERIVHTSPKWQQYDDAGNVLKLTPLYDWYGEDFGDGSAASIIANAAPYVDGLNADDTPTLDWLPYDWSLNKQ